MSTKPKLDWYRKNPGVAWGDVWEWCNQVRDTYGLWCTFEVVPPLPSQAKKTWGTVVMRAKRSVDGGEVVKHLAYRAIPYGGKETPEQLALSMVAALEKSLDREVWEAERAAGQGTLPF